MLEVPHHPATLSLVGFLCFGDSSISGGRLLFPFLLVIFYAAGEATAGHFLSRPGSERQRQRMPTGPSPLQPLPEEQSWQERQPCW